MAQRIIGVDLGSHRVKVAVLEVGFRKTALKRVVTVPVTPFLQGPVPAAAASGEEDTGADSPAAERRSRWLRPDTQAVLGALRRALGEVGGPGDRLVVGLPGDLAVFRTLQFEFSDPRKVEAVLAYELEGEIPFELDDVVHEHVLTGAAQGGARALVGVLPTVRAASLLEEMVAAGADPDVLTLAPFGYGALLDEEALADGPVAVVDIGHERTHVVLLQPDGGAALARTISRGGAHVTREIARRYAVSEERAEEIKHTYAQLPAPGTPGVAADRAPVVEATRAAVEPLLRALRQTLLSVGGASDLRPRRVWLCGGTSGLPGLPETLSEALGVPVTTDLPAGVPAGPGARAEVLAVGIARAVVDRRRPLPDFRKGALARKEQVSLLRRRALYLTWTAVVLLGLLVLGGFLRLSLLRTEDRSLRRRLAHATLQIFDKPMNDPEAVNRRISRALKRRKVTTLPIPDSSAYGLLSEISRRMPPRDKSKLDVTRLHIRPGKMDMTATAKDAQEVEAVVEALKKIPCVKKVKQGRVTEVTVREPVGEQVQEDKRRQFKVDVTHECI